MKIKAKFFIFILSVFAMFFTYSFTIEITNIELSSFVTDVYVGQKIQIKATVLPKEAPTVNLNWTTSDLNIATIDDNGLLTIKSVGQVTVTVTAPNGVTSSININVNQNATATLSNKKTKSGKEMLKTSEVVVLSKSDIINVANEKGVFLDGRKVQLDPFIMGQYEVTQELFEEVMGVNPSNFKENKLNPVENVSWYDAIAFCNKFSAMLGLTPCYTIKGINDWLNFDYKDIPSDSNYEWDHCKLELSANGYRLPTEAEWEYAARGGQNTDFSNWTYEYAGSNNIAEVAWYYGNSGSKIHEVGLKVPNKANLYDMSGNVWEWCYDWFTDYISESDGIISSDEAYKNDGIIKNPLGADSDSGYGRINRGGSWRSYANRTPVSQRDYNNPYNSYDFTGFRLVRSKS